MSEYMTESEAE